MYHHLFPQQLLELRQEASNPAHLELHKRLDGTDTDVYVQLAEIAAYCDIILDGNYTQGDVLQLCELLTKKLYQKRTQLILPF